MVRMFLDSAFVAGLDGIWNIRGIDDWNTTTQRNVGDFIQNYASIAPLQRFGASGFSWDDRIVIVRHPLWDTVDPQGIFADWITDASIEVGENKVRSVDSFDLFKRPAWVFRKLSNPLTDAVFHLK